QEEIARLDRTLPDTSRDALALPVDSEDDGVEPLAEIDRLERLSDERRLRGDDRLVQRELDIFAIVDGELDRAREATFLKQAVEHTRISREREDVLGLEPLRRPHRTDEERTALDMRKERVLEVAQSGLLDRAADDPRAGRHSEIELVGASRVPHPIAILASPREEPSADEREVGPAHDRDRDPDPDELEHREPLPHAAVEQVGDDEVRRCPDQGSHAAEDRRVGQWNEELRPGYPSSTTPLLHERGEE